MNRRQFAFRSINALAALAQMSRGGLAVAQADPSSSSEEAATSSSFMATGRPPIAQRTFTSDAVEDSIAHIKGSIRNPQLATLFENCYPNTLDTTVQVSERNGKPDTFVITGDIPAMWLRDSSAQVLPYVQLVKKDPKLQLLFRGLIHRQADCILLDSYANAFYATKRLGIFATDLTEMRPGVHERKWEVDSLCYCIRLAYSYWSATGDAEPLDDNWRQAAHRIVATFREQQRLKGDGPYRFQRSTTMFYDNSPNRGLGNPTRKIGLLHSAFRPSDDACLFPFLIPSNMFAITSMRQLHKLAVSVLRDEQLAGDCARLADELQDALQKYAIVEHHTHGNIYAYEIDGFGNSILMDDANVPSLLSLPYLGCCEPGDAIYRKTRAFVLSDDNPYFFRGVAEGIGGPHVGPGMIWPLSIIMRALTSDNEQEIEYCLRMLIDTSAGSGFMHESFNAKNPKDFTRPWFAWCNSLFGELIVRISTSHPAILQRI
jgi:meiotically up-regulated gene 157 (Mug157) protein